MRPLEDDDLVAARELSAAAFHETAHDDSLELERGRFEPKRTLGVFDGEALVGTAGAYTRDMTIPGGPMPVAHVTWVSVHPAYTRRGILTRMMRQQLDELYDQGEPVAALWASESPIYSRFGYGLASRHFVRFSGPTREMTLTQATKSLVDRSALRWGMAADPDIRKQLTAAYERVRGDRVGYCSRNDAWWEHILFDPERDRDGYRPLTAVVYHGTEGPEGYVLYTANDDYNDGVADGKLRIKELHTATPRAHATLWDFIAGLDLISEFSWYNAPIDEPVVHMITNPGRINTRLSDNLWVRIVRLEEALTQRSYLSPVDVVFEIDDDFLPANSGRWHLRADSSGSQCQRTDANADLSLSAVELGACYLGGTTLTQLAAAGRVVELSQGALARADQAFRVTRAPHCSEIF